MVYGIEKGLEKLSFTEKVFHRCYLFYHYKIFPKVQSYRGSFRITRLLQKGFERNIPEKSGEPQSIFERGDWDNLILLDACRHDLYREVNGSTSKRTTLDSITKHFIRKTFSEGEYEDLIYISASPYVAPHKFEDLTGRKIEDVFDQVHHLYLDDVDEDYNAVRPEKMAEKMQEVRDKNPEKRIISHFVQPHTPFFGTETFRQSQKRDTLNMWEMAELGLIDKEQLREDYKENLKYVMDSVKKLGENLQGRTVVTSDHGNLIGEKGRFGHPGLKDHKSLREVPWDVISES